MYGTLCPDVNRDFLRRLITGDYFSPQEFNKVVTPNCRGDGGGVGVIISIIVKSSIILDLVSLGDDKPLLK